MFYWGLCSRPSHGLQCRRPCLPEERSGCVLTAHQRETSENLGVGVREEGGEDGECATGEGRPQGGSEGAGGKLGDALEGQGRMMGREPGYERRGSLVMH